MSKHNYLTWDEIRKKQERIIKRKINSRFRKCLINKNSMSKSELINCLNDIWFEPTSKEAKFDSHTLKGMNKDIKKELV